MSLYKKIGLGLCLLISISGLLTLAPKKALAATEFSYYDWNQAGATSGAIKFPSGDISKIIVTVAGTNETFTYTQTSTNSSGNKYRLYKPQNNQDLDSSSYIRVTQSELSKDPAKAYLYARFHSKGTDPVCPVQAGTWCDWPDNGLVPPTETATDISIKNPNYNSISNIKITDPSDGAKVKDDKVAVSVTAKSLFGIAEMSVDVDGQSINGVDIGGSPTSHTLNFTWDSTTVTDGSHDITATLKDTDGNVTTDKISVTTDNGIAASDTAASCADNGQGWALTWIACPVFDSAGGLANSLMTTFRNQMSFTVNDPTNSKHHVNADNLDSLKQSWSIFRDLASAFLVVIMLVMIFSQAISFGPFDAYTLRKMLPRMVIAIILMQFSWVLFNWAIDAVNFIGNGLGDLLYAPFGTPDQLNNLNRILGHALGDKGMEAATVITVNWVLLIALIAAVYIALPTLLLFIFLGVMALLVGLATLIFRRILIIMCLITAPVALLVWILPSQSMQKLFKMWSNNFMKALMMYPLLVLIIAGGRVFAWISSTTGDSKLIIIFMVLIGYFGPLFILPKTFKWGGTAMAFAGKGLTTASTKLSERPKKYFQTRQESLTAERRRQSQERYLREEGFRWSRPWRRPLDLFRSGQWDPLLAAGPQRRREEAMRKYRTAGAESEDAEMKAADQDFAQLAAGAENHDNLARMTAGARIGETITYPDRYGRQRQLRVSKAMKRAGMNAIVKYNTDRSFRDLTRILDELHHGSEEEQVLSERFLDSNAPALKDKLNYLYRGASRGPTDVTPHWNATTGQLTGPLVSRREALSADAFASIEAPDLEALLSGFSRTAIDTRQPPAARNLASQHLENILDFYEAAINNDQIRDRIGPSVNQAMKAFLDGTGLVTLNANRRRQNNLPPIEQVAAVTRPDIASRITDAGVVSPLTAGGGGGTGAGGGGPAGAGGGGPPRPVDPHSGRDFSDARGPESEHGPEVGLTGLTYSRERAIDTASPPPATSTAQSPTEEIMPGPEEFPSAPPLHEAQPDIISSVPSSPESRPPAPPAVNVVLPAVNTSSAPPVETRRSTRASTSNEPQITTPGRVRERSAEEVIRDKQRAEDEDEMVRRYREQREKERQKITDTGELNVEHNEQPGTVVNPDNSPPQDNP